MLLHVFGIATLEIRKEWSEDSVRKIDHSNLKVQVLSFFEGFVVQSAFEQMICEHSFIVICFCWLFFVLAFLMYFLYQIADLVDY